MEGIQTKGRLKTDGPGIRIERVEVNTVGLHFVLFVVDLPQFRGGSKVLALGGFGAPPLPLAGYGPDSVYLTCSKKLTGSQLSEPNAAVVYLKPLFNNTGWPKIRPLFISLTSSESRH